MALFRRPRAFLPVPAQIGESRLSFLNEQTLRIVRLRLRRSSLPRHPQLYPGGHRSPPAGPPRKQRRRQRCRREDQRSSCVPGEARILPRYPTSQPSPTCLYPVRAPPRSILRPLDESWPQPLTKQSSRCYHYRGRRRKLPSGREPKSSIRLLSPPGLPLLYPWPSRQVVLAFLLDYLPDLLLRHLFRHKLTKHDREALVVSLLRLQPL